MKCNDCPGCDNPYATALDKGREDAHRGLPYSNPYIDPVYRELYRQGWVEQARLRRVRERMNRRLVEAEPT